VYLVVLEGFADWEPAHAMKDRASYVDVPAVRDRGLITASGLGDVEFARALFDELDVLTPKTRDLWSQIFRTARLPAT
jgi:hypothetical protein